MSTVVVKHYLQQDRQQTKIRVILFKQEVIVVSGKRQESDLVRLWRHRPGRELVAMTEDVFMAKWHEGYRPIILKHAATDNGRWMMIHLPAGLTYSEFNKAAEAVSDYTKAVVTVERKGDRITLEITRRNDNTYPFTLDGADKWKGRLPIPIGYTAQGRLIVKDLVDSDMLVAGQKRYGKSNFLHVVANSLLLTRPVEMYIIDLKVLEFSYLKEYVTLATDPEQATKLLKRISGKMVRRLRQLERQNAVKIQDVNNMNHIVLIIDELAELSVAKDATVELNRIMRLGGAPGISVVCATQRPSSTVHKNFTDSRALFGANMCFWVRDRVNSEIVLDNGLASELPRVRGRAIFQSDIQQEVQVMSLPVSPEDRPGILQQLEERGVRKVDKYRDRSEPRQEDTT